STLVRLLNIKNFKIHDPFYVILDVDLFPNVIFTLSIRRGFTDPARNKLVNQTTTKLTVNSYADLIFGFLWTMELNRSYRYYDTIKGIRGNLQVT
ncbi:hypothetical protein L9F63_013323, partial [Diploptera punctata]